MNLFTWYINIYYLASKDEICPPAEEDKSKQQTVDEMSDKLSGAGNDKICLKNSIIASSEMHAMMI
jgi:hypothetical protein